MELQLFVFILNMVAYKKYNFLQYGLATYTNTILYLHVEYTVTYNTLYDILT